MLVNFLLKSQIFFPNSSFANILLKSRIFFPNSSFANIFLKSWIFFQIHRSRTFFKVVNIFLKSRIFFPNSSFANILLSNKYFFPNSSFANFFWINDIFTVHAPGSLRWQRISVFWYFFIFILCRVLFITHRNSGLFAAYCYGYCLCASWPVRACQGDFGPEWHTYCTLRT